MSIFEPVERTIDFPAMEAGWAAFWKDAKIFDKQLAQGRARAQAEGKSTYVFYEGPPTANGMPHPGHILTRVIKDLFPRLKAMQGHDVPRKAGWDTHGLPVEVEVEKILGIEGKQGIVEYGVEPFIQQCKESVWKYSDLWAKLTERIAFWIDLDDPYITYHQSYIESVWWSLKAIFDAGLIYHGHKIVPWCARCGTTLSSQEVGQGYKDVADPSAFVAFRSKDDPSLSFLAWTTTPWTLLSNVALAVGVEHDYDYVRMTPEQGGDPAETFVLASALRAKVLGKREHEVLRTVKGADLLGLEYEQLFPYATVDKPAFRVVAAPFVGLDTGTGIVHMAPAFGQDDYAVGQENDLPMINLVAHDGTFVEAVTPWAGVFVKEADKEILKDLRARGRLLKAEQYTHSYPFCWRCDAPLLYYPRPAWYIRTTEIKDRMLQNNAAIDWHPEHIQTGRFGNFLETNVDWALSRERFWGTPLPIWECGSCAHRIAIGSQAELVEKGRDATGGPVPAEIELHKPYVDAVLIACETCGGEMKRVPEVIDCWYDSGAMPFAQWGYPYAEGSAEKLAAALPADFISEAIDQTRGWFYTLLAIGTLLKVAAEGNGADPSLTPWRERDFPMPYKRCLVMGHVCDEKGEKMSKSKGNYLDPWEILNREGADAMRWFFYSSNHPWTSVRFFESAIRDSQKDFLLRLRNVYSFFVIYANIDGFDPRAGLAAGGPTTPEREAFAGAGTFVPLAERSLLDRWLISKLEGVTETVTRELESMSILTAAQALHDLVDGLSNWFVRRSRDRFWAGEKDTAKWSAYWTLYEALGRIALLLAPFTPYMAEELYQRLFRDLFPESLPESIHLCHWPTAEAGARDAKVEGVMDRVRELASLGLSARAGQKLKVRQPLARAIIILADPEEQPAVAGLAEVVKEELNIKALDFAADASTYVQYQIKPDFKRLGPKLGKDVKKVAGALAKGDAAASIRAVQAEGKLTVAVDGAEHVLEEGDLDIRIQAKEGFAAAGGAGGVVVLDATVTEELEREGLARELINRVQGLRKELDLPYEARIAVRIGAGGAVARAALEHGETIAVETLASDYKVEFEELAETRAFTIGDEEVKVSMRVV